jgi:hypothetical protein
VKMTNTTEKRYWFFGKKAMVYIEVLLLICSWLVVNDYCRFVTCIYTRMLGLGLVFHIPHVSIY